MLLRTPAPMLLHLIVGSQLLQRAFCKDVNQAGIHFVHPKSVTWGNDHVDASNNILWALPNTSTTYHNDIKNSTFGAIFMQSVAGSLIDVFQGGHLSVESTHELLKGTLKIDDNTADFNLLINYSGRYRIFFIACLLFAVAMPWIGIAVFWSPYRGFYGGLRYNTYTGDRFAERQCLSCLIFFLSIMLGYGAFFGHMSNYKMVYGIDKTKLILTNHLKDISLYIDSSLHEIEHYALDDFLFASTVIRRDLANIGSLVGGDVGNKLKHGPGLVQPIKLDFATNLAQIRDKTLKSGPNLLDITGRGHRLREAGNHTSLLKKAFADEERLINAFQLRRHQCPPSPALCGSLDASRLRVATDLNDLPDVDRNWVRLNKIIQNQGRYQRALARSQTSLDLINYRFERQAKKIISDFDRMANTYRNQVRSDLKLMRRLQRRTMQGLAQYKSKLDTLIGDASLYGTQWWSLGLVLFSVTTVIVALQLFALLMGSISNSTAVLSTKRSIMSNRSGEMLVLASKLIFIVSWLMMLTACVSFPVSGIFQKVFCEPLLDNNLAVVKKLLDGPESKVLGSQGYYFGDLLLSDSSKNITLSEVIIRCSRNELFLNVLQYNTVSDITKRAGQLFQLVDMRKLLRSITVATDDLAILDAETREALEDTRVGVDIMYDDFIAQLSSATIGFNIQQYANEVRLAASDSQTMGSTRSRLNRLANRLLLIEKNELATAIRTQKEFLNEFTRLKLEFGRLPDNIENTIAAIDRVRNDLLLNKVIPTAKTKFVNRLNKVLQQYWYQAVRIEDAGHCGSFYQKHRQFAEIGMCTDAISPFHGYWVSLVWSALFMTACIAVNYRLSRHYLVMEIADQTEIERYKPTEVTTTLLDEDRDQLETSDIGLGTLIYMRIIEALTPATYAAADSVVPGIMGIMAIADTMSGIGPNANYSGGRGAKSRKRGARGKKRKKDAPMCCLL